MNTLTFEQINRLLLIVKKLDSDYRLSYVGIDEERFIKEDKGLYLEFSTDNLYIGYDNDIEWEDNGCIDVHIAALESDENAELYVLWRESLIGGDLHKTKKYLDECNKRLKEFHQNIKNIEYVLQHPKDETNSVIPVAQKNLIPYLNTQLLMIKNAKKSELSRLKNLAAKYHKYIKAKEKWEKIVNEYKK